MLFCVHGKFIRPAYSLQGVILILLLSRYLHARIILFRPILADLYLRPQYAKDDVVGKESSLSHHVIVHCACLCFEAAHEMLDVLFNNVDLDTVTGPVPAWWFSVLCMMLQLFTLVRGAKVLTREQ